MTRWRALALVTALAACSSGNTGKTPPTQESATAAVGAPAPTPSSVARDSSHPPSACPEWGNWQPCSVELRLTRAGLVVTRRETPVHQPFLHVSGTVYDASNAEVQVYLYKNAADRARDTDVLDTTTVAPRGTTVIWREPPTLVVSNNLAAIILTVNGRQAERIALALGAGMPLQPPR